MVISANCHVVDEKWLSRKWWDGLVKVTMPVFKRVRMGELTKKTSCFGANC